MSITHLAANRVSEGAVAPQVPVQCPTVRRRLNIPQAPCNSVHCNRYSLRIDTNLPSVRQNAQCTSRWSWIRSPQNSCSLPTQFGTASKGSENHLLAVGETPSTPIWFLVGSPATLTRPQAFSVFRLAPSRPSHAHTPHGWHLCFVPMQH